MIDPLDPLAGSKVQWQRSNPAARATAAAKVQDEFLTIFYKEMLKTAFKAPDLSPVEDGKEDNSFLSSYRADLMIEQLAQELVKSGQLRPDWFQGENK